MGKGRTEDGFSCSLADLRVGDTREHDRRQRIEAEANRFAAHLLTPPTRIRSASTSRQPDMREIVRLAGEFGVSREAMARGYIDALRETLAVVILRDGCIDRIYRNKDFPWIEPRYSQPTPADSIATGHDLHPGQYSDMEECDPETGWSVPVLAGSKYYASRFSFSKTDGQQSCFMPKLATAKPQRAEGISLFAPRSLSLFGGPDFPDPTQTFPCLLS